MECEDECETELLEGLWGDVLRLHRSTHESCSASPHLRTFQVRFTQVEVRDALGELINIAY